VQLTRTIAAPPQISAGIGQAAHDWTQDEVGHEAFLQIYCIAIYIVSGMNNAKIFLIETTFLVICLLTLILSDGMSS
jgi:hypothetical protein